MKLLSNIKSASYCLLGVFGSMALVMLILVVGFYGLLLEIIVHPQESANRILGITDKFQHFIDKKMQVKP